MRREFAEKEDVIDIMYEKDLSLMPFGRKRGNV